MRGAIKGEEKRNRSPPVLIFFFGGGTRESIYERKAREGKKESRGTTEPGGVGEQRRGISYKKGSLLLMKERGEKRAKEKLLLASWTQCQTQSASGLAARLVSQAPAHNGGDPGPPHLSLPICVLQDGTEGEGAARRDHNALEETLKFLLYIY